MKHPRRHILTACLIVLFVIAPITTSSQGQPLRHQPTEYEVKAAFLFNFAKFIDWPISSLSETDSVFTIGVLGDREFYKTLIAIIGSKKVKNRRIEINYYNWYRNVKYCHILFVGRSERRRLPWIFRYTKSWPTLKVGNGIKGFVRTGGMINFIMRQNTVNFEINPDAASRNSLQISSKLLRLADIISENSEARR